MYPARALAAEGEDMSHWVEFQQSLAPSLVSSWDD